MSTAGGLSWAFAAAMVAVAGYHGVRLITAAVRRRRYEADVDVAHAAMGVVMALMLVGSLTPAVARSWAFAAALPTVWFLGRSAYSYVMAGPRAVGPSARQAITSAAMLYMLIIATGPDLSARTMSGMTMPAATSGTAAPSRVLGVVFLAAMVGVIVWTAHAARCSWRDRLEPAAATACQLAMSATSVYMLAVLV